jgi:hypothetical protein
MLIYLDLCCLKRPFDDQSQPRIRLESEAVLALLAGESEQVRFVRSAALLLENAQNPVKSRASRVEQWLIAQAHVAPPAASLQQRTAELMRFGFKNFDALHLATAEHVNADAFASCDDQLLASAVKHKAKLTVRVTSVIELAKELLR